MYGKNVSQLKAEMDVAMGGRAAEEVVFGPEKVTTGLFPMLDFLFLNISAFIGMYTFTDINIKYVTHTFPSSSQ